MKSFVCLLVAAIFCIATVNAHEQAPMRPLNILPEGYVGSAYEARTCEDLVSAMNVAHHYNTRKQQSAEKLFREYEATGKCSVESFPVIVIGKNLLCGTSVHIVEATVYSGTRYYLTRAGWSPKKDSEGKSCASTLSE